MSYEITTTPHFEREAKPLIKKYSSLVYELGQLINSLAEQPVQGTSLANNCYKIRLAIKSKGKGKSGGARVITCVIAVREEVLLLSIYDKSERETITNAEIKKRIETYLKDL
jgi:mRNA-degrading endonuclease RelE of RelBE toxin-antitoxin system